MVIRLLINLNMYVAAVFLFSATVIAADLNGYTAKYEHNIGPVPADCDQLIRVNDGNWSKITNNKSDSVFCLERGDHRGKGELTLNFSGTTSSPKWLRYYSATDNGNKPVKQQAGNRAILRDLVMDGASNWIIHRITINPDGVVIPGVHLNSSSNNNIFDSVLVENAANNLFHVNKVNNTTIQNSVIRNSVARVDIEPNCITLKDGPDGTRIVNNEIYDCNKSIYFNATGTADNTIIENNDLYVSKTRYTDCNGHYTQSGVCATSKAVISMKTAGSSNAPVRLIHNRIWGARTNDTNICCLAKDSGENISLSNAGVGGNGDANYVLIKDNVIMDAQAGIIWTREGPHDHAIVSNIFYNIHRYNADPDRNRPSYALAQGRGDNVDIHLNTIVNTDSWISVAGGTDNTSVRCNVIVSGGNPNDGSIPSTTVIDNNAFYGTSVYTDNGNNTNIQGSVASSATRDFCFSRKLQTGAETICIPNAMPTEDSPHYQACPSSLDSRSGIDVNI